MVQVPYRYYSSSTYGSALISGHRTNSVFSLSSGIRPRRFIIESRSSFSSSSFPSPSSSTSISSVSSSSFKPNNSTSTIHIPSFDDINAIRTSCGLPVLTSLGGKSSVSSSSSSVVPPLLISTETVHQTLTNLQFFHENKLLPLLSIDNELRSQLLLLSMQTVIDLAYALSSSSTSSAAATATNPSVLLGTEPFLSCILTIIQGFTPLAQQCALLLQQHKGTHIPTLKADHYSVPIDQVILLGGTRLSDILMNKPPSASSSSSSSSSLSTDGKSALLPYYEQRDQWTKELNKEEVHIIAPLLRILYQLTNITQDPLNGGGGFAILYSQIIHMCITAGSAAALTACVRVLASRDLRVASIYPLNYLSYSRETSRRNELQAQIQGSSGNRKSKNTTVPTIPHSSPRVPILAYNNEQWDTLLSGFTHLLLTPAPSLILQYTQTLLSSSSSSPTGANASEILQSKGLNHELINHLLLQEYPKVYLQYTNMTNITSTTASTAPTGTSSITDHVSIQLIQDFFTNYLLSKSTVTLPQYQSWLQLLENTFAPYILMHCSNNQLPLAVKYMDTCQALMQWLPLPSSTSSSSSSASLSVTIPQPSAEIWEALIEVCCRLGQPNRAKRILQSMLSTGIKPTKRYTSIQSNILVSLANKPGKETEIFIIWQQMQDEIEKLGYRLPASAYVAVMEAMLRIQETDKCYQVLRTAQSKGILRSIDNELYTKGILNLSGLSSSLLSFILYQSLGNLRNFLFEKQLTSSVSSVKNISSLSSTVTVPPAEIPSSIKIYHRATDRLHIRGLLQGINPPLEARTEGKAGKERYLFIDEKIFFEWIHHSK